MFKTSLDSCAHWNWLFIYHTYLPLSIYVWKYLTLPYKTSNTVHHMHTAREFVIVGHSNRLYINVIRVEFVCVRHTYIPPFLYMFYYSQSRHAWMVSECVFIVEPWLTSSITVETVVSHCMAQEAKFVIQNSGQSNTLWCTGGHTVGRLQCA